jgi:hypothetical protein
MFVSLSKLINASKKPPPQKHTDQPRNVPLALNCGRAADSYASN